MEKQRIYSRSKSVRRLLNLFFVITLFTSNLYSQVITASEINALKFKPAEGQDLYTKTDLKFEMLIPKVKASQIQFLNNNQRADITFRTMRKTEDYENGGTLVEVWFNFENSGTYTLNPIQFSIQGRRRNLNFEKISVSNDPAKQNPRIVIKFNNGATAYSDNGTYDEPIFKAPAGEKILLTVYLQYASQLMNFNWDIPKDAIFSQTRSYEIMEVKYREKNITHDLIPVASFEWTSLAKGSQTLPKMKINATSYNGTRYELIMPELSAVFVENANTAIHYENEKMFDAAFNVADIENQSTENIEITREICEALAEMYSKERHSIFSSKAVKKARQEFEMNKNLPVNYERDFSFRLILGTLLLLAGGIILLILSIHEKHSLRIMIAIFVIIFAIVAAIYGINKHFETQAICTGCTIYSIPEENAEAKAEMGAGNKVHITEKAGKWYYIELGETGGWCKAENIILIK